MPKRNIISQSVLISGYSQMGMAEEALCCFKMTVADGFEPNDHVYVGALSACSSMLDARAGKEIHAKIYRSCVEFSPRVSNCLINMYGKCGLLGSARFVFDAILEPDSVSWTALLSCCCQSGKNLEGLKIFLKSYVEGVVLNEFSCATVLGASAALEDLRLGMQFHSLVVKCGFEPDKFVVTGLVDFYAKCGDLDSAFRVFSEADQSYLSVWTALIGGYAQQGKGKKLLMSFACCTCQAST
ncbi:pentatricopeptide repeat-containing protein At2g34400-like [Carica papaya]|uniref:pentatricopeptide repeat-containing protein At2g34400-like n=1 Tax=Carica papaya TaxID=3649 RepID=UPI000B8D1B6E|nr:pentatricopeptide repeat-containing protein At2g34400-like [Carica papaya]